MDKRYLPELDDMPTETTKLTEFMKGLQVHLVFLNLEYDIMDEEAKDEEKRKKL